MATSLKGDDDAATRYVLAVLTGLVWLSAGPARADFCLTVSDGFPGSTVAFLRFKGKYSTTPEKVKALVGKVTALDSGNVIGRGAAYGASRGLPVGDAGVSIGATFAYAGTVASTSAVLDDNAFTQGGATTYFAGGPTVTGMANIVDCATEPVP